MQPPPNRPLRVGLDLIYMLDRSGGTGTYARELIPALLAVEPETSITAWVNADAPAALRDAPWSERVDFVHMPVRFTGGPHRPIVRMGAEWVGVPWQAARRQLDVVHGLANVAPLIQPRAATVVTLHDLIWLSFAESMDAWSTWAMKATAPPSARAADRVLAVSEAARDDLVTRLGLPRAKIDVIPHGIARQPTAEPAPEADVRRSLDLGQAPVVLCVAQKRSHKNIAGLLRALPLLADPDAVLVVPGESTPYEDELKALAASLDIEARVRFPGWLSDAELEALYAIATAFVLPSFEEGFGLPILEAMRRGTPVACSDASSLPEVAGDAALLFDPHDPAAIAHQVGRLLADPELRAELSQRGLARCDEFTWERTARATLAAYRRAIAGRRERRAA